MAPLETSTRQSLPSKGFPSSQPLPITAPEWHASRIRIFLPGSLSIVSRSVSGESFSSSAPSESSSDIFDPLSSICRSPWVLRYTRHVSASFDRRKASATSCSNPATVPGPFTCRMISVSSAVSSGRKSVSSAAIVSTLLALAGSVPGMDTNRSQPISRHRVTVGTVWLRHTPITPSAMKITPHSTRQITFLFFILHV